MEEALDYADALSPPPIDRSEPPPSPSTSPASLAGFEDGDGGGADDEPDDEPDDGVDDSQLAVDEDEIADFESPAAAAASGGGEDATGEETVQVASEETAPTADDETVVVVKRKRGRPPKSQSRSAVAARALPKKKEKEEDVVCFICFDGGSLVLCDRRGCPKVYHPACINRDDSFFRLKGRWNCGWHICSICQKSAQYLCYTCTYSLCKRCNREAEFVCVRGNKGFCGTCYRTIMLIESNEVGVDFNDENSWEHLFKVYWLDLKGKLLLTQEELSSAKNRRKGSRAVTRNEESSDESYNGNVDQESSSDSSSERLTGSNSSRKKVRRRPRYAAAEESSAKQIDNEPVKQVDNNDTEKQVDNEGAPLADDTEWASKELLEFVAHMRGGCTPILSQFDVQALLLEYIKRNNLRDPRRKSQIICDSRLQNLFGKARVGHFEMLKLLESHFLIKEGSQIVTDDNHGGVADPDSSQIDAEGYSDAATRVGLDKRRKGRKRVEEREPQTNLDDYAAIDIHNINLIYLRRNLLEDLIDDIDKFNEKVVGAFVRIRISGAGQRQDMYRLVQVSGTHKAAEKYKTGKKTTDTTLEILNLNKTEIITIDTTSNQEFTEEECKRLRQSIKCGLIHRLRVGEIQEKARDLQAVRVNDWLESEKLRLGHLRDRASEKGRRKELRECVEKLQLLSTPEERRRRLNEIPEIHADPHMDPSYESAEEGSDDKNQDNYSRSRESFSMRKRREAFSSGKGGSGSIPSHNWNDAQRSSNTGWEMNQSASTEAARDKVDLFSSTGDRTDESAWSQGKDTLSSSWGSPKPVANTTEARGWNANPITSKPEQSFTPEARMPAPCNTNEADKIWNYLDPAGKVQGPFSMVQMRKWSTTGYFPCEMKIWRTTENQDESILLTDALNGNFDKQDRAHNTYPQPAIDGNSILLDPNRVQWSAGRNNAGFLGSDNNEAGNSGRLVNQPSAWFAAKTEVVNPMIGSVGWEASGDPNVWIGQPLAHSSLRPTAPVPVPVPGNYYQPPGPPSYQDSRGRGVGNTGQWNQGNAWSSNRGRGPRPTYERQQPNWTSSGQQFPGEVWKPRPAIECRNQWGNDSFNPPSPTPQPSSGGGWGNVQNPSPTVFQQGQRSGIHQSPVSPVGGWGSKPAGEADGWGSWSSAPASNRDKPGGSDGRGSWSPITASMPDKTYKAEPMFASSQTPQAEPHAITQKKDQFLNEGMKKDRISQGDCPSPTPLFERREVDPGQILTEATPEIGSASRDSRGSDREAEAEMSIKPESGGWSPASAGRRESSPPLEKKDSGKQGTWSPPSPTPVTKRSGWDVVADSGSKPPSSQSNTGWEMATQNPSGGIGAAEGNGDTGWGTLCNKGWGTAEQGNANAAVTVGQQNPNPNIRWGPPTQGISNPNAGWGNQNLNPNPNAGWRAPPSNAGWASPAQGNTMNPVWGGNPNPNPNPNPIPGWRAPAGPVMHGNQSGVPGWVSGNQQNQNGGRYERGGHGYQSSRMQSGGGGRPSRPPPGEGGGGQRAGVCRFHESGHCKKGLSCNFLHP